MCVCPHAPRSTQTPTLTWDKRCPQSAHILITWHTARPFPSTPLPKATATSHSRVSRPRSGSTRCCRESCARPPGPPDGGTARQVGLKDREATASPRMNSEPSACLSRSEGKVFGHDGSLGCKAHLFSSDTLGASPPRFPNQAETLNTHHSSAGVLCSELRASVYCSTWEGLAGVDASAILYVT